MEYSLYLAGVGGQGLQIAGKSLAEAAMNLGYNVTYSPKYGPAKRGGLSSCYVVIADDDIGNPRKRLHDITLVMEPKAYSEFKRNIKDNGILLVNRSLIKEIPEEDKDINMVRLPMYNVCTEMKSTKIVSSVLLGILTVLLKNIFPDRTYPLHFMLEKFKNNNQLIDINRLAFEKGCELIEKCEL